MNINFPALEAFYWAAQLRSFNKAAERLNITQPTVSYRIRELEEQLGVPLFLRKRQLALTGEGDALVRYAEQMIGIARNIDTNIRTRNPSLPTLRVGVVDSFAVIGLPRLLDTLDSRFPETRIAMTVNTSHDLAEQLSEGLLDIAVLSTPPVYENIELELLGLQEVAWLASPRLGLDVGPVSDTDLLRQRILATPAPSNLHQLTTNSLKGTVHLALRLNYCNNLNVIVRLVEAGSGIGILPVRLLQDQLQRGEVHVVETGLELPMQEVYVGSNRGSKLGALKKVNAMIRSISTELAYCR
ncbi:LysR family transcriptional regulator [Cucumibacter marinus]|uniref:LysR family transcriptional regulator n=1 Tax=Cucumibacter marinus TaxID=1121252 RepID=UPI000405FFD6|nr:LysR family transcriptional regulator [Cucumibacter marinus]